VIAKKPKSQQEASFIRGAGASNSGAPRGQFAFVRVGVNFDQDLLAKLDGLARSMGLNRSAFIVLAVGEKIRQLEREG
jgi:hypothetical protein